MPERTTERREDEEDTVHEIFMRQRKENIESNLTTLNNENIAQDDIRCSLPPELVRNHEIFIIPGENEKWAIAAMRDIKASTIGSLVTFRGIVVKASDARPAARVVCYSCEACGFEVYQTVSGRDFNPLN